MKTSKIFSLLLAVTLLSSNFTSAAASNEPLEAPMEQSLLPQANPTESVAPQSVAPVPVLNPIPLATNQNHIDISGTAFPGSVVYLQTNYGGVGTAVADEKGQFQFSFSFYAEGQTYAFWAVAELNGTVSEPSATLTTTYDTTPPGWFMVDWFLSTPDEVTLTWDPPINETQPSEYIIYRDGIEIGRTFDTVYRDPGRAELSSHSYKVIATDLAGNESPPSYATAFMMKNGVQLIKNIVNNPRWGGEVTSIAMNHDGTKLFFGYDGPTDLITGEAEEDWRAIYAYDFTTKRMDKSVDDGNEIRTLSGDGNVIVYSRGEQTFLKDLHSADPTVEVGDPYGSVFSLSDSGDKLVVTTRQNMTEDDADSGQYKDVYIYDRMVKEYKLVSNQLENKNYENIQPDVSGDGRFVVYVAVRDSNEGSLYLHHVGSGTNEMIDEEANYPSISTDGSSILYAKRTPSGSFELIRYNVLSEQSEVLVALDQESSIQGTSITADSNHVLYYVRNNNKGVYTLNVLNVETKVNKEITVSAGLESFGVNANAEKIVFSGLNISSIPFQRVGYIYCEGDCTDNTVPEVPAVKHASWKTDMLSPGYAALGSELIIQANGAPNNQETEASISYKMLASEGVEIQTSTIDLAASPAQNGLYEGRFPLQEGIIEVTAISVQGTTNSGQTSRLALDRLPIKTSGGLQIQLEDIADPMQGAYIVATSNAAKFRNETKVEGSQVSLSLIQADDYQLTFFDKNGILLTTLGPVPVQNGKISAYKPSITVEAFAKITLLDDLGKPLPHVGVNFNSPETKDILSSVVTDTDGVAIYKGLALQDVVVSVTLPPPFLNVADRTIRLFSNQVTEIVIQGEIEEGFVSGKVIDANGNAVKSGIVTINGLGYQKTATTDESGNYALSAPKGKASIQAYGQEMTSAVFDMEVTSNAVLDFMVSPNHRGYLKLNIFMGNSSVPLSLADGWGVREYKITNQQGIELPILGRAGTYFVIDGVKAGETLSVCVLGRCESTELDSEGYAELDLRIAQKASVTGTLVYDPNNYHKPSMTVYALDENGQRKRVVKREVTPGTLFSIGLEEAGRFDIEFIAQPRNNYLPLIKAERSFLVTDNEEKQLGEISLKANKKFITAAYNFLSANPNTGAPGMKISMRGTFRNEDSQAATNAELFIHVSSRTRLAQGSVLLNGQPVSSKKESEGVYKIPVGDISPNQQGTISYWLIGDEGNLSITSQLKMRYSDESNVIVENLDSESIPISMVSLDAPKKVYGSTFLVSGRAPDKAMVSVYNGDKLVGQGISKGGFWKATIHIGVDSYPSLQYLQARINIDGQEASSLLKSVIVENPDYGVKPQRLSFSQMSHASLNLENGIALTPFGISLHENEITKKQDPILFHLDFQGEVDYVKNVVLNIGGYELPMERVGDRFQAVLEGPHGGYSQYLYIDYDVELPASGPDPVNELPDEAALLDALEENGVSVEYGESTVIFKDDEGIVGEVSVSEEDLPAYPLPDDPTGPSRILEVLPPTITTFADGTFAASIKAIVFENPESPAQKGVTAPKQPKVKKEKLDFKGAGKKGKKAFKDIFEEYQKYRELEEEIYDFMMDVAGYGCLPRGNSILDKGTYTYYMFEIKELQDWASTDFTLKSAATAGGILKKIPLYDKLNKYLSDALDQQTEDQFNKLRDEFRQTQIDIMKDKSCHPSVSAPKPDVVVNWMYDPSGYVFEAVPSNRLEGVTATALQKVDGKWQKWDAEWFNQSNPLITNKEGRYAWDVPEGLWKVLYEKEGYEPAQSAELTVLPPHYDVNIPLVSKKAPEVTGIFSAEHGTALNVEFSKYMLTELMTEDQITVTRDADSTNERAGTFAIEFIGEEKDVENQSVARIIRIIPQDSDPFVDGEKVKVELNPAIMSYAKVPMLEGYAGTVSIIANPPAPNEAVSDVAVTKGHNSIGMTWTEDTTAAFEKVHIYMRKEGGDKEEGPFPVEKGTKFYGFGELEDGSNYNFRLATVSREGLESTGVMATGTPYLPVTDRKAPNGVSELHAVGGAGEVQLTWKDPQDEDLDGLYVFLKQEGDEIYSIRAAVPRGVQSYHLKNLAAGKYEVTVAAYDHSLNESVGATQSVTVTEETIDTTAPQEVTELASRVNQNQVQLSWTDPTDQDLAQVKIYLKKQADAVYRLSTVVAKGVEAKTLEDLLPGVYQIKLTTVDTSGNESAGRVIEDITIADPPTPDISVTGVELNTSNLKLFERGRSATLIATVLPSNATNKNVQWSITDPAVAAIDQNGKVTPLKEGVATVTVTTMDGQKKASAVVTVAKNPLGVSEKIVMLQTGKSTKLQVYITDQNGKKKNISSDKNTMFKSSDENMVSVKKGLLKAGKQEGNAIITIRYKEHELNVPVVVSNDRIIGLTASLKINRLEQGDAKKLTVYATYSNKPKKEVTDQVTFISSNQRVATVTDGNLKALKPGKTVLMGHLAGKEVIIHVVVKA